MTRLRTLVAVILGLMFPVGLLIGLYAWDWRHAAAGFVLGLTGAVVGTATPRHRRPWPRREDL